MSILAADLELKITAECRTTFYGAWRWTVRRDEWDGQHMVRTVIARGEDRNIDVAWHDGRNAFRQIVAAERAAQQPPLDQVADAIWAKNRPQVIQAIKDLRAQPLGISLKEAKDAIDAAKRRAGD